MPAVQPGRRTAMAGTDAHLNNSADLWLGLAGRNAVTIRGRRRSSKRFLEAFVRLARALPRRRSRVRSRQQPATPVANDARLDTQATAPTAQRDRSATSGNLNPSSRRS